MNHSFYKILKYEFQLNFKVWLLILTSSFAFLVILFIKLFSERGIILMTGSNAPIFIFLCGIFTLHAYSESTTRQTMELYHLLPVSRNVKFFSKQLITFIIYPILLLAFYFAFVVIYDLVTAHHLNRTLFDFQNYDQFYLYLWAQSIATLMAIVFKKRKILYAIAAYFGFQLLIAILFALTQLLFNSKIAHAPLISFSTKDNPLVSVFYLIIPVILYVISYRLFFRRQL